MELSEDELANVAGSWSFWKTALACTIGGVALLAAGFTGGASLAVYLAATGVVGCTATANFVAGLAVAWTPGSIGALGVTAGAYEITH